ncbi:MAG TPA: SRPBCC family protein [Mycobacteriales bacterium]|nr:SRPBCC family protein [Mycobacteriales bacterium]
MLSDDVRVQATVAVDASVERTWAVVTDWAAQGDWIPFTTVAVVDPEMADGPGKQLIARTGFGRAAIVDPMSIDVWQPPHRCEVAHHGRIVTGRGVFLVEELPDGRSTFTWQELPASHGVRGTVERLGSPISRWALGVAARRLAHLAAS